MVELFFQSGSPDLFFPLWDSQINVDSEECEVEIMLAGDLRWFGMIRVAVVYHLAPPRNVAEARRWYPLRMTSTRLVMWLQELQNVEDVAHEDSTVATFADETISFSLTVLTCMYLFILALSQILVSTAACFDSNYQILVFLVLFVLFGVDDFAFDRTVSWWVEKPSHLWVAKIGIQTYKVGP